MMKKNILIIDVYHFEMSRTWIDFYSHVENVDVTLLVSNINEIRLSEYLTEKKMNHVKIINSDIIYFLSALVSKYH